MAPSDKTSRRKLVKHRHEPGDLHELTFSCYQRRPLLTRDAWRAHLARSIDNATAELPFRLGAFVFMPEHVHLLVFPTRHDVAANDVSRLVAAIKRPCSVKVNEDLLATNSLLLSELTVRERPGRTVFRFWQEGSGYDRNLRTPRAVLQSIDYLHLNPVRRGLCEKAQDWRWSSARFYLSDGLTADPELPAIHGVPRDLFS